MRELKFRAWNLDDNKMEYPIVLSICNDGKMKPLIKCTDGNMTYKDYPLMQYTGLKDKNGVEIYEGDIVTGHTSYERDSDEYEWTKENPCTVVYDENKGGFYPFTLNSRWRCDLIDIQVIGNIYQNP